MCRCEEAREDEPHIVSGSCPVYRDIRENYQDLKNETELVKYFNEVLERRDLVDKLSEEEEGEGSTRQGSGPALPLPASWDTVPAR
jgi:hypothetical protein